MSSINGNTRLKCTKKKNNGLVLKFLFVKLNTNMINRLIITLLGDHFTSTNPTSSSGCNETDLNNNKLVRVKYNDCIYNFYLSSGTGSSFNCGCFTNMLMITTTVRMLNGIHSNTTNLRPAVTLGLVFVVRTSSLQHRLVNTSSTGHQTCIITLNLINIK